PPPPPRSTPFPYTTLFRSPNARRAAVNVEARQTHLGAPLSTRGRSRRPGCFLRRRNRCGTLGSVGGGTHLDHFARNPRAGASVRSEEHTSELQSRGHLVCR